MASSVSSSLALPAAASAALTCPLTGAPFIRPWILLEDGYTYEKAAIEAWLEREKTSPKIGAIPSATLLPNCAVVSGTDRCPITKEPFKEPYFCKEDCKTYEKEAIITWFNTTTNIKNTPAGHIRQPLFNRLTLYPNRILFAGGEGALETIFLDNNERVFADIATRPIRCIFDREIRGLIFEYTRNPTLERQDAIHERRRALGLECKASGIGVDLSHLNLSKMSLVSLFQGGMNLEETDFSDSSIRDSHFACGLMIRCNFTRTRFMQCRFEGEGMSFFKTDVQEASFDEECILEKATVHERILDPEEFRSELKIRGALNTETISFKMSSTGVKV